MERMEPMEEKKLADLPRETERMAESLEVVVKIEMLWVNGHGGKIIEHWMAMNTGAITTDKIKITPDPPIVAEVAAEMMLKLLEAFRQAHGAAIVNRAAELIADAQAGMIKVVAVPTSPASRILRPR